ncbi:hypothetical protein ACFC1R_36135 [Kitasatospora sp. NPDC056138]
MTGLRIRNGLLNRRFGLDLMLKEGKKVTTLVLPDHPAELGVARRWT